MRTASFSRTCLGLAGLGIALLAWLFLGAPSRTIDMDALNGDAARGAYVVRLAGCVSCHTQPKEGKLLGGGPALNTPFGVFFGPNITSDITEGIGAWTADEFVDALVNGHSERTGHLYPVFPFTSYSKMNDRDVADLWAFLQTVPPDATPSRPHEISSVLAARILMAPWKTLFHDSDPINDNPKRSPSWNRGRYIVSGIGHCTECHTPRSRFGALDSDRHLEGGVLPPRGAAAKGEKVPAITSQALAKRGYSKADLLMAFRFGLTPDGDVLGGAMGEVLTDQLEHLSAEDLEAIAGYLLDTPPE